MELEEKQIKRYNPNLKEGLNSKEINERITSNLVNYNTSEKTKDIKTIIRENTLTLFNIINFILALAVVCVGSFKNLTFMGIIIINTLISIMQEVRSKKTLDKLQILSASKVNVLRNSIKQKINIDEIVLDDIILYSIGNQIVVDAIIEDGEVEVDESFITGESKSVYKKKGDMLLSGSFIISGKVVAKVEHIGKDNYTAKISSDTKYIKVVSSEIMRSLNKIVKTISFIIIPVGILLFSRQMYIDGNTITQAVVSTVAAIIGMIPEGLVLLTSTVLAVSAIRLANRKVLVQDLYCIETLARVNVICLDKTGTITLGKMEVVKDEQLDSSLAKVVGTICHELDEDNPTAIALKEYYKESLQEDVKEKISFSSKRKYSGIVCKDITYAMGAFEFLLSEKKQTKYRKIVDKYNNDYRVITVVSSLSSDLTDAKVLGFILLRDMIRNEAKDTLDFFKKQGVKVKIISGDNPTTVLNIAKRAGLDDEAKAIDATTLKNEKDICEAVEKYAVFGRVTPTQKKSLVIALQNQGNTVAMTGDGVNDILALKEADCSIAMASGSDACKNVSQLVLLDSNFASMPYIVYEGRRTINNIQRSASLFLVKTIYATILSLVFIFVDMPYPFIPIQLTLASVVTIGIPSFILALEPNDELVKGEFLPNVLKKAFPAALTIVLNILVIVIISKVFNLSYEQTSTLSVTMTGYTSFILLYKVCSPFNVIRRILYILMLMFFILGLLGLPKLFSFSTFSVSMVIITLLCIIMSHQIYNLISEMLNRILKYFSKRKRKNLI